MRSRGDGVSTSPPPLGAACTSTEQGCAPVPSLTDTHAKAEPSARLCAPAPGAGGVMQPTRSPQPPPDATKAASATPPRRHRHCAVPRLPVHGPRPPKMPRATSMPPKLSDASGTAMRPYSQSTAVSQRHTTPYTLPGRGTNEGSSGVSATSKPSLAQQPAATGTSAPPPRRLERIPAVYTAQPGSGRVPASAAMPPTDVPAASAECPANMQGVEQTRHASRVAAPSLDTTRSCARAIPRESSSGVDDEEKKRLYAKSLLIPELFNDLAADIMRERPADVVEYTLEWLKSMRQNL